METVVTQRWYPTLRAAGVTERDCRLLAGAFAYPGFRLDPAPGDDPDTVPAARPGRRRRKSQ
jgi:hypothetical protein